MAAAADFYMQYVRFNLWWVFLAGLAIISYRRGPKFGSFYREFFPDIFYPLIEPARLPRLVSAMWSLIWPYWLWMLVFGVPATIADVLLGPSPR